MSGQSGFKHRCNNRSIIVIIRIVGAKFYQSSLDHLRRDQAPRFVPAFKAFIPIFVSVHDSSLPLPNHQENPRIAGLSRFQ
jgi:hypothetical protein